MNNVYIVVYGTLMAGEHNHDRFLKGCELIGEGTFQGNIYTLPYGFPAVVKGAGRVVGEVYSVPLDRLPNIDRLEGYDKSNDDGMYLRRHTYVKTFDGRNLPCYYYHWNNAIPEGSIKLQSKIKWTGK